MQILIDSYTYVNETGRGLWAWVLGLLDMAPEFCLKLVLGL